MISGASNTLRFLNSKRDGIAIRPAESRDLLSQGHKSGRPPIQTLGKSEKGKEPCGDLSRRSLVSAPKSLTAIEKFRNTATATLGSLSNLSCASGLEPNGGAPKWLQSVAIEHWHTARTLSAGNIMKNIAYDAVQAVLRKWTPKTGASRAASYKKNSDFGSMPAYRSIKKYEKVGRMLA